MNCSSSSSSGKTRKNPLGMDRGRECRRGGSSVLALRRPRSTAFKDSSVADDDEIGDESPNPRLRERPRKESVSSSSSALFSSKRMKRQHVPPSPDMAAKARSNSDDETDEKTEDVDMSAFDSNEDLPPPPVSKRPSKLRPQGKASDEGGGASVDLIAVPRKTRTAMMKRPPESLPEITAKQPSYPISSSSFAPTSTSPPPTSTRRLKLSSGKVKGPKIPKSSSLSSGISEQEVEVAETLFGLWRMVPNQPSPVLSEAKTESKEEIKHNATSSSPARSPQALQTESSVQAATSPSRQATASIPALASTSPSHSAIPLAEAPKKKRHRIKSKTEDCIGSRSPQLGIPSLGSNTGGGSIKELKAELEQPVCSSGIEEAHAKTEETTGLSPSMPTSTSPSNANSVPIDPLPDKKLSTGNDTKPPEAGPVSADLLLPSHGSSTETEVPTEQSADLNLDHKESNNMTVEPSLVSKSPQIDPPKSDQNTESQSQALPNSCPPKFEIDLMALPVGTVTKEDEKVEEDTNMADTVKIVESDFTNSFTSNSWMDQGRETKVHREEEQQAAKSKEEKPNIEYLRPAEKEIQANVLNEGKREKEKAELSKQPSQQTVKSLKAESKNLKLEKSRPSPSLPASTSPTPAATSNPALSIPLGMAGWPPTSLHPLGFYSPAVAAAAAAAAASWPGAATAINGHAGEDSGPHVAPFTFPTMQQKNWKRCGRHVYIAHFIELQQQIQRHPIWAASYGNAAAGLFGSTKQYNLIPPMDTLFGNGAHLLGPSPDIAANRVSETTPDSLQERDPGVSASNRGSRERCGGGEVNPNPDTASKKPVSQQPPSTSQLQPTPPLQIGSSFGFPLMHNTAAASGLVPGTAAATGPNLTGTSTINSPVVSANAGGGMMSIANGSAMVAAAQQAQYLQAMIQQTGFPFTFSQAAHFGTSFNGPSGHIAQHQATPMFGNPYCNARSNQGLHSQQIQIGGGSYTGVQPSQQQPTSHPPSPSQTPLCSSVSQNISIKEGGSNSATEIAATADARFPAAQQNMLGQMTSAAHGSKSASKAQQQAAGSTRMQPHGGSSQNIGPNAALQTNFNSSDAHASSQSYAISMGNTARASPVGSGPLGLASVAPIIAPQGHAMLLQNMGEATRSYPPQHTLTGQQQNLQQQQLPPSANKQKARASGAEDTRVNFENSSMNLGKEREPTVEVRKNQSKRNLPSSGVEVEGSFASGNGGMNMNSMSAAPFSQQQSPQFSLGGPANPLNHNPKSGGVVAGHHHHVTKGVVPSSSADPSLVYYADHSFAASFGKAASPGLSFQNPSRQGSLMTPQNTATAPSKASQRASMGSSTLAGASLSKHPQGSQQLLPSRASSPQSSSAASSLPLKASAVSSKTANASLKSLYPPQKQSSSLTASPGKRSTANPASVSNASHMSSSSGRIPQQQKQQQQGSGLQQQQQELIQSLQQQNSKAASAVGGQQQHQQQQSMAQLYHNQQQWQQLPVHSLTKSLQSPPLQMRQNNAMQQQQQIYQAQYHSQQQSVINSLHQQGSSQQQQQQPPPIIASGNSQAQSQSFKHSQQRGGSLHTPQSPTASLGSGGNVATGLSFPFPNPSLGTTSGRTDGVFSMQISGSRSALSSKPSGSPSGTAPDGSGSLKASSGGSVFLHSQANCPPNNVNSGQKQAGET